MKIRLSAFGQRLVGYMEVPEETGTQFSLVLTQPIQVYGDGFSEHKMMDRPLATKCTFEWEGKTEMFDDEVNGRGARIYVLTKIDPL